MGSVIGFVFGLIVGGLGGFIVMGLAFASKNEDLYNEFKDGDEDGEI